MTNPLKGEIEITLGEETYKARLTVDALVNIEQSVGCGIVKLANKMAEGDISIKDSISVLTPALRGGGNDFTEKEVKKIVQDVGITETITTVANLLTAALTAGMEEDDGEKKSQEPK